MKSNVLPSQKVTSSGQFVWVLIEQNGDILTVYCSCTAGLSRCCNHVIYSFIKLSLLFQKVTPIQHALTSNVNLMTDQTMLLGDANWKIFSSETWSKRKEKKKHFVLK